MQEPELAAIAMPPKLLLGTANSLDSVITESPSDRDMPGMPVLSRGHTEPELDCNEKAANVDEMSVLDEKDEDALNNADAESEEDDEEDIADGEVDPAQTERALATAAAAAA